MGWKSLPNEMNHYWLEPPETPEPPECCGQFMEVNAHGCCSCLICGKVITADKEELMPEDYLYDEIYC